MSTSPTYGSSVRNSFLVYIAGVACPVSRISVTSGVWTIPSVTIEVPPDRTLIRLGAHDRVPFAIFYLDTAYFQSIGKPPQFCLLAEGELTGWAYQNTSAGRMMSFSGQDYFNCLTKLYPYLMTGFNDLIAGAVQQQADGSATPISEFTFPASLFFLGLNQNSKNYIKKPFDFLQNIVTSICGNTAYNNYKSTTMINFFSRWLRKNNFLNRLVPSPILEANLAQYPGSVFPLMQAIQSDQAMQMFIPALSQQGDKIATSSMWELIQSIFGKMYYEIGLNPAPACVTTDLNGVIQGKPQFAQAAFQSTEGAGAASDTMPVRLLNYVTKPALQFTVPPACNVLYPSMIKSFMYQEDYSAEPTRAYFNDSTLIATINASGTQDANFATNIATMVGSPLRVQQEVAALTSNHVLSGKNFLVWPDEYFIGPTIWRAQVPSWFMYLAKAITSTNTATSDNPSGSQLNNNLIYQFYADNELQRMRCEPRNGAVVTIFDPYVVAAFPGVIFDNLEVGNHVFAYFTTVTHNLSITEASTQIGYTYAQPFGDFFDQMAADLGNVSNFTSSNSTATAIASTAASLAIAQGVLVQTKAAATAAATAEAAAAGAPTIGDSGNADEAVAAAQATVNGLQATLDTLQGLIGLTLDASPASPIPAIREQFQNVGQASNYYTDLFYQGQQPKNRTAVFNWHQALGLANPQNPNVPTEISFDSPGAAPGAIAAAQNALAQAQATAATVALSPASPEALTAADAAVVTAQATVNSLSQVVVTCNAQSNQLPVFQLKAPYASIAENSMTALMEGSRPVCTLENYIDFYGERGLRNNPVGPTGPHSLGATYYVQILDFEVAPADAPVEDPIGSGNIATPVTANIASDWQTIIKNYRNKVLGLIPQGG